MGLAGARINKRRRRRQRKASTPTQAVIDDELDILMPELEQVPEDEEVQKSEARAKEQEDVQELEVRKRGVQDVGEAYILRNVFGCEYCKELFNSELSLLRHQSTNAHFYCSKCDRRYNRWASFLQHLADSKSHSFCSECELEFLSPIALRGHFQRTHDHRGFWCPGCDVVLAYIAVLVAVLLMYMLFH